MTSRSPARRALIATGAAVAIALALGGCSFEDPPAEQPPAAPAAGLPKGADGATAAPAPVTPLSVENVTLADGSGLEYLSIVPPDYRRGATYPILVALPPGDQGAGITENTAVQLYFREARKRGWIVISPIAPDGRLFFDGAERTIPQLLLALADRFVPEGDKYHLVGLSNGGVSAFRLAIAQPGLFQSLLVFPGYPRTGDDFAQLDRLRRIPVRMIVGQNDTGWVGPMRRADRRLRRLGGNVTLQVEPDEGHILSTVDGRRIFDILEPLRPPPQSAGDAVVGS